MRGWAIGSTRHSLQGPLVAGLIAGLLTGGATIAVQRLFDSGFCDDSDFGCLVPALVLTFATPPITALIVAFVLARLGVHRPYVVGFATLVTVTSLLYVGSGSALPTSLPLPVALGLLTAIATSTWVWALQPERGVVPPLAVAGLVLTVVAGTIFVVSDGLSDDRVQRLALTGAPPLLLEDADWSIVSVSADGPERISEIYDATESSGEPPRLVLKISPRPDVAGPDTACRSTPYSSSTTPRRTVARPRGATSGRSSRGRRRRLLR